MNTANFSKLTHSSRGHAVVLGGSMAGLLAARVLAGRFDRVTIIEPRDRFPEGPTARKGVPQARHAHVLLVKGREILEDLFPGIREELQAGGALVIDSAEDIAWLNSGGWAIRYHSDLPMISASRDLLDWGVRRRVLAMLNIEVIEEADVVGLVSDDTRTCVRGVTIRRRNFATSASSSETLQADLVVDATGRNSRAPEWLKELGYEAPEETVVNSFLSYASRVYKQPAELPLEWKGLYVQGTPKDGGRGGLVLPMEGGRWMVTLSGRGGVYPPTDEAGFIKYAQELSQPILFDAIKDAEPLTPISGYRATENRLRHYERLARMPEGFILVGDAVCAFNPVYGQGMTTAALGAMAIREMLESRPQGFAQRFQKRLAQVIAAPWLMATSDDARFPNTVGGSRSVLTRVQQWYVDRVFQISANDAATRHAVLEVMHLTKPPSRLFRPGVLWALVKSVMWMRKKPVTKSDNAAWPPREEGHQMSRVA